MEEFDVEYLSSSIKSKGSSSIAMIKESFKNMKWPDPSLRDMKHDGRILLSSYKDQNESPLKPVNFVKPPVATDVKSINSHKLICQNGLVNLCCVDTDYTVGGCNFDEKLELSLRNSPDLNSCIEFATNCLTPATSSGSPSMMCHQIAVVLLSKMLLIDHSIEEQTGIKQADISFVEGGRLYSIDVTGGSVSAKKKLYGSQPVIVINKYDLLSPFASDQLEVLMSSSRISEGQHTSEHFLERREYFRSKFGLNEYLSKETIDFFMNGKDPMGRDISEHFEAADKAMKRRVLPPSKSEPKVEETKRILEEAFQKCTPSRSKYIYSSRDLEACSPEVMSEAVIKTLLESRTHQQEVVIDDRIMKFKDDESADTQKLFKLESNKESFLQPVPLELDLSDYGLDKQERDIKSATVINDYLNGLGDTWLKEYQLERAVNHMSATSENLNLVVKTRKLNPMRGTICVRKIDSLETTDFINTPLSIDPHHALICTHLEEDGISLAAFLARSMSYQECRFRARISRAIQIVFKADKPFVVNHHKFEHIKAVVTIRGKLFENDEGVAMVSFLSRGVLRKYEVWRLPDVENFSVSHDRCLSTSYACLLSSRKYGEESVLRAMAICTQIIRENSWGVSKFLKPFRYFTTGVAVSSPLILEQAKKLVDSLGKSNLSKWSIKMILDSIRDFEIGKTACLRLPLQDLSTEAFWVNLCPGKTYGRKRHLYNTMQELFDEIDLFNSFSESFESLWLDFEMVLFAEELDWAYEAYLSNVMSFANESSGRFTSTPMSLVLISNEVNKLKFNINDQEVLPPITELMTTKASFDALGKSQGMAANTISSLVAFLGETSTSMIIFLILECMVIYDMTMRMFDKEQVGGDREISIMSNIYRFAQTSAERFAMVVGKKLDNEFLNKPSKTEELFRRFSESQAVHRSGMSFSTDQSRWAANWPTPVFGLMFCMMSKQTTEWYYPALACLLAEYKIFESPVWLDTLLERSDSAYTIPGKLGRAHMGQGIFHNCSSVFHSFCAKYLESLCSDVCVNPERIIISTSSMVTSDDSSYFFTLTLPEDFDIDKKDPEESFNEVKDNLIGLLQSNWGWLCNVMGYLTSPYKNIASRDLAEFNSTFISSVGISHPNLKFAYSLVTPLTTGNFTEDLYKAWGSYYDCRNSGCERLTSYCVSLVNIVAKLRAWKCNPLRAGLPSLSNVNFGIPIVENLEGEEQYGMGYIQNASTRKFKLRGKSLLTKVDGRDVINALIIKSEKSISHSRSIENYKTMITRAKGVGFIAPMSDHYRSKGAIGESYTLFAYHLARDPTYIYRCINPNFQIAHPQKVELASPKMVGLVYTLKLRTCDTERVTMWDLILSSGEVPISVTALSSQDDLLRHLMRNRVTRRVLDDPAEIGGLSLPEQIEASAEFLKNLSARKTLIKAYTMHPSEHYERTWIMPLPAHVVRMVMSVTCKRYGLNMFSKGGFNETGTPVYNIAREPGGMVSQSRVLGPASYVTASIDDVEINLGRTVDMIPERLSWVQLSSDKYFREKGFNHCYVNVYIKESGLNAKFEYEPFDMSLIDEESVRSNLDLGSLASIVTGDWADQDEEPEDSVFYKSTESQQNYYSTRLDSIKPLIFYESYWRRQIYLKGILEAFESKGVIQSKKLDGKRVYRTCDGTVASKVNRLMFNINSDTSTMMSQGDAVRLLSRVLANPDQDFSDYAAYVNEVFSVSIQPVGRVVSFDTFLDKCSELAHE